MTAFAGDRFCCVAAAEWYRVLAQSEAGVMVDASPVDPEDLWRGRRYHGAQLEPEPRFFAWQELDVPLPHRGTRCWGYALTYPEHRRETLRAEVFRFLKKGSIAPNSEPIPHREFLDFELEIGLLMHRDHPDRFGYFLANDLTDRGLQVKHYDADEPEPGFALAKEFPGSLRAGPLLALGDSSLWPQLTASLTLNETLRQTLRAADCHLEPKRLHRELFRGHHDGPWLLAITGTPGGTLFRTPRTREKLKAIISGRLSVKRARQCWLLGLKFLMPGDRLVMESRILGRSETIVV